MVSLVLGSPSVGTTANLAVHLAFLPTILGDPPDPKKITDSLCEFRKRLAPEGQSDHWWNYGVDEPDASRSVDDLVNLTQQVGLPHFERFRSFPGPFDEISPQSLMAGDFTKLPGNVTAARGALAMARISAHLGRSERAREFAAVGVASLGPSAISGVGVARELATLAGQPGL